jgi:hypothetical protein
MTDSISNNFQSKHVNTGNIIGGGVMEKPHPMIQYRGGIKKKVVGKKKVADKKKDADKKKVVDKKKVTDKKKVVDKKEHTKSCPLQNIIPKYEIKSSTSSSYSYPVIDKNGKISNIYVSIKTISDGKKYQSIIQKHSNNTIKTIMFENDNIQAHNMKKKIILNSITEK